MCSFPACARCGCPRDAHLHFSPTRACGRCGPTRCAWYRHPRSPRGVALRARRAVLAFLAAYLPVVALLGVTVMAADLEDAARAVVPWSSDPLDDVDWVRNDDGTVTVFPAESGL